MTGLALVIVTGVAFVGTHFLLSHPLRAPMVARLGERGFLGVYSLVAFATMGAMIGAAIAIGPEPLLWTAPGWAWALGSAAMLLASILLAGSLVRNPAAPTGGAAPATPDRPRGVYAITRHPMMWSFALWSVVHGLLWPQPSTLVLSAAILVLALGGAAAQDAKKRRLFPDRWRDWTARTTFVPFARAHAPAAYWPGAAVLVAGILLWIAASWAHAPLGAPPVGPWRWIG